MSGDPRPIAWLNLDAGTPVIGADDTELGTVGVVVGDEQKDIFHGITIRSGLFSDERLVPADRIEEMLTDRVIVRVTEDELESLEVYRG